MLIPDEAKIKTTIRTGSVFYFIEESFHTSVPHYYVVMNNKPLTDEVIILVCATTFDQKKYQWIDKQLKNGIPKETFVDINPKDCSFLKSITLFNCNEVFEKSIEELIEKLEDNKLKLIGEIEGEIFALLKRGADKSPLVENRIKDMLKF